jgi:hypothetical protein
VALSQQREQKRKTNLSAITRGEMEMEDVGTDVSSSDEDDFVMAASKKRKASPATKKVPTTANNLRVILISSSAADVDGFGGNKVV